MINPDIQYLSTRQCKLNMSVASKINFYLNVNHVWPETNITKITWWWCRSYIQTLPSLCFNLILYWIIQLYCNASRDVFVHSFIFIYGWKQVDRNCLCSACADARDALCILKSLIVLPAYKLNMFLYLSIYSRPLFLLLLVKKNKFIRFLLCYSIVNHEYFILHTIMCVCLIYLTFFFIIIL